MNKMNVLVTGGIGYIGSHTVVELINKGYEVLIADNLSNSNISVLNELERITNKKIHLIKGDLCEKKFTDELFKNNKIDAVIHFAAYKAVGESVEKPLKYYTNNIASLINIIEASKENQVQNLVFSSSCSVYGEPDKLPVDETCLLKKPESPSANTKQICEEIINDYIGSEDYNAIILRYFNPIGAHDTSLIGELPLGIPNNLVPYITQTAIGIRERLSIFGGDYDTPDGTCIRDYIHVVDLAKAHVIAVDRLLNKKNKAASETFNLGTGKGYSVLETVKTFEKVADLKLNYKIVDRRAGDVVKVFADTKLANEELGWKAERDLENMLLTAWNWEKALYNKKK
jgi:UDP-glucose 4-epimerase